jgi:hypothetical protein
MCCLAQYAAVKDFGCCRLSCWLVVRFVEAGFSSSQVRGRKKGSRLSKLCGCSPFLFGPGSPGFQDLGK